MRKIIGETLNGLPGVIESEVSLKQGCAGVRLEAALRNQTWNL